jgi:hypothetical protein
MSSECFSALDMLSEDNAAHPAACDSPLQIIMAVSIWRTFFYLNMLGWVWHSTADKNDCLARFTFLKSVPKTAITSAAGCHTQPDHLVE